MSAEFEHVREALRDRYAVTGELGRGGMAVVYVARDLRHDREVAVKVLAASTGAPVDPARFAREIRIAARLTHQGIVPVFDSGAVDDLLFYVMPLIRGESLRARMLHAPALTATESCAMLADVADALDSAHRADIVHRDVKPENILIADGRPLVTDFGIARIMHDLTGSLTRTGTLIGTVLYMSPEQIDADQNVDGRADVFAVGCILFEILGGAPPFAAPTLSATLARLATEESPELPVSAAASPAVRAVLARALARDPARRYATAHALAEALRGAATGSRSSARSIPAHPVRLAVLVLAAVAAVVAATKFALRTRGPAPVPSIAVLPFVNASADTSLEYVSQGITDELRSALGNGGIAVASRDASMAWKGRVPTPAQVADSLRVDNLLEGSVRQTADSLRITASLIDGKSMLMRKSFAITRKRADVFSLQEEVAEAVVAALRPSILGVAADTLVRNRTKSLAAYDLTLRAAYLMGGGVGSAAADGGAPSRLVEVLALADSAIALDSSYAPAWARRAIVLQNQSIFGDAADTSVLRLARDAAARAVALDERNPESQLSYGLLLFRYEWRWPEAEQHLRRAIALDPRLFDGHTAYARFLRSMGRFDEARAERAAAYALKPSRAADLLAQARISYFARDYPRAIRETRSGADSTSRTFTTWTAQAYVGAGDYVAAKAVLDRTPSGNDSRDPETRALLYALTGRGREARAILAAIPQDGKSNPILRAGVLVALGEKTSALDLLEQAMRERDASVVDFKVYPLLDGLRTEPRFQAMMRTLNFP